MFFYWVLNVLDLIDLFHFVARFFTMSSSAIEPVTYVINVGRFVAQILCFSEDQHTTDQCWSPEAPPQHAVCHLTVKSKVQKCSVQQICTVFSWVRKVACWINFRTFFGGKWLYWIPNTINSWRAWHETTVWIITGLNWIILHWSLVSQKFKVFVQLEEMQRKDKHDPLL